MLSSLFLAVLFRFMERRVSLPISVPLPGSFLVLLGVDRLEHFGASFTLKHGVTKKTLW